MAGALSRQMSGHIAGDPAAIRVMSLKPPAARRSSAVCASVASVARPMSVAAVSAHVRDDGDQVVVAVGSQRTNQLRGSLMTDWMVEKAFGSVDDAWACEDPGGAREKLPIGTVGPSCSDPSHRVPPNKRGWRSQRRSGLDAANVGDHELARRSETRSAFTSARWPRPVSPRRRRSLGGPLPISSTAPSSWARRARTSSRSLPSPTTPGPAARERSSAHQPQAVTCARCEMTAGPVECRAQIGESSLSPSVATAS